MSNDQPNHVKEIAQLALSTTGKIIEVSDGEFTVEVYQAPNGSLASVKKLVDEYREAPKRREGTARMQTLESFCDHVNRFKDGDSAVFANRDGKELFAVLDYHRSTHAGQPRFGTHRTHYAFPLSDEWLAWNAKRGAQMSPGDFAEFLEDRIVDVIDPEGASDAVKEYGRSIGCHFASPTKLLELSRGLSIRVGTQIKNAQNLASGETHLTFATEHTDERGAPIKVPGAFVIAIPVFRSSDRFEVGVRLRYRLREGAILWTYDLARLSTIFDTAFDDACNEVGAKTGLPVLRGLPE